MMLHRYSEAAADCAEALRLDPTMVKLLARRGRALLRLGNTPRQYDHTLSIRPHPINTTIPYQYTTLQDNCSTHPINIRRYKTTT